MKVILRADVENLGRLGDVVEVRAGYGRNFLLPQGIATLASAANIKNFELERRKLQAKMDAIRSEAASLAEKLQDYVLEIKMRVGDNEKLYGSITTHTIADLLIAQGFEIDRRKVLLEAPIRMLGEHPVRVRLHADVVPTVLVKVLAEERILEGEAPAPVVEAEVEAVAEEAAE